MKAKKFLAKVMAVTMVFAAAGAVLPDSVTEDYSISASAGSMYGSKEYPVEFKNYMGSTTLHSFIEEAPEGTTMYIRLAEGVGCADNVDHDDHYCLVDGNKTVNIDLNGQTMDRTAAYPEEESMFVVCEGSTLNITSTGSMGSIDYGNASPVYTSSDYFGGSYLFTNKGGTINIYDGAFRTTNGSENLSACIYDLGGTTNVYGGYFNSYRDVVIHEDGNLNVYDAEFTIEVADTDHSGNYHGMKLKNQGLKFYNCTLTTNNKAQSAKVNMALLTEKGEKDYRGLAVDEIGKYIYEGAQVFTDEKTADLKCNPLTGHMIMIQNRYAKGDLTYDNKLDIEDAVTLLGYINGTTPLTSSQFARADVDTEPIVDIEDVVAMINHINGVNAIPGIGSVG